MWGHWMVEQTWAKPPPDEATLQLRRGIAEFRHRLRVVSNAEAPA
jgi:hypothetical protein